MSPTCVWWRQLLCSFRSPPSRSVFTEYSGGVSTEHVRWYAWEPRAGLYNDETIIPALCNRGVSLADARNYGMIGCVVAASPQTDGWHDSAFVNVAKILELTLNGGKNNGHQVGPDTGDVTSFKSIEDVWRAFEKQIQYFVHHVVESL